MDGISPTVWWEASVFPWSRCHHLPFGLIADWWGQLEMKVNMHQTSTSSINLLDNGRNIYFPGLEILSGSVESPSITLLAVTTTCRYHLGAVTVPSNLYLISSVSFENHWHPFLSLFCSCRLSYEWALVSSVPWHSTWLKFALRLHVIAFCVAAPNSTWQYNTRLGCGKIYGSERSTVTGFGWAFSWDRTGAARRAGCS